eukprot:TRINITY_DN100609_c0_g1_i1.p1 TRINITY_DN100609_c0_g1~~TRINITY_DN100609_c0_g1_i1.p1  ORF type:complete len:300 (+),score=34.81 TRINITY_DN100609_c0_g1_i1:354-1253(+)
MEAFQGRTPTHHANPVCLGQGTSKSDTDNFPNATDSLNSDPYNLRSEELALAECMLGVEVRRTWSETDMVRSSCGNHLPGTPDGMFENWDGDITCVQVVRAPLVASMSLEVVQETLSKTVLTKVIKSQRWLAASSILPAEFIVFCWLPYPVSETLIVQTEELMQRIRGLDPRFSLRLRVPAEPGDLFPARFASSCSKAASSRNVSESDVSTFNGDVCNSDDDDDFPWGVPIWDADWSEDVYQEAYCDDEPVVEELSGDITGGVPAGLAFKEDLAEPDKLALIHNDAGLPASVAVWDPGG